MLSKCPHVRPLRPFYSFGYKGKSAPFVFAASLCLSSLAFSTSSFANYRYADTGQGNASQSVRAEQILCIKKNRKGWKVGTATVLPNGTRLTANHVVEGCSIVYIGKKSYSVDYVDAKIDLAVLGSGRDFRQLNCAALPKRRPVQLTGYPEGAKQPVISQGLTKRSKNKTYAAVEGFAMKGMSGGPVVQSDGKLAGIFKAYRGTSQYWYVPGPKICASLQNLRGASFDMVPREMSPEPDLAPVYVAQNEAPQVQISPVSTRVYKTASLAPVAPPSQINTIVQPQRQAVISAEKPSSAAAEVFLLTPRVYGSLASTTPEAVISAPQSVRVAALKPKPVIQTLPVAVKPDPVQPVIQKRAMVQPAKLRLKSPEPRQIALSVTKSVPKQNDYMLAEISLRGLSKVPSSEPVGFWPGLLKSEPMVAFFDVLGFGKPVKKYTRPEFSELQLGDNILLLTVKDADDIANLQSCAATQNIGVSVMIDAKEKTL